MSRPLGMNGKMITTKSTRHMRHNVIYLLGALAILASCAKEVEKTEEPVVPAGKEQVTIIAQTPQTRTTAEVDGTNVIFSWQENETIAVVEQNATAATPFTVSNRETGAFEGTKTAGNNLLFAVSPAQDLTAAATASTITSYTITLPATYENYVPGTTNAVMIGTQNGEASGDVYPFRFAHAAALVKVTYVNVPVGTKKLGFTADKNINGSFTFNTTTGVTIETPNEGSTTTWLELSEAVTTPNQTMEFYIPVPAATYGQFNIALYKVEGNEDVVIAETKKKKSSSTTLAVGDVFVTPTVTLPEVAYYVKVTSAPSDWSGDYLIVYQADDNSTSGEVLTGVTDNVGQHSTVSISHLNSNSKILANRAYNVKIEKSGNSNNYTMKLGTKYLAYTSTSTSGNNNLYAVDNASTNGTLWTLSLDDAQNVYNTNRYLRYNTGYPRFCCYNNTQSKITFYKLEDNTTWDLKGIAVTQAPKKTAYIAGDYFDPTEMVVTATYQDHDGVKADKTEDVALADLTLSPSTSTALTAEDTAITITYNGKSTTQPITVTATYILTLSSEGNGTVTATVDEAAVESGAAVAVGKTVTITTTPVAGYQLATLVYNDGSGHDIKSDKSFTMPAHAVTVTATFSALPTHTLTLKAPGTGYAIKATVGGNEIATSTTEDVSVSVVENAVVTISAPTIVSGYTLSSWTVDGASKSGDTNPATFTMGTSDVTVTASFAEQEENDEEITSGTFSGAAAALSMTTSSGITITQLKGDGTDCNSSYNTVSTLRVYRANQMRFSGKTFTKIEMYYLDDYSGVDWSVVAGGGTVTIDTTNKKVVWVNTSGASTVTLQNSTSSGTNIQLRTSKFYVVYN